MGSMDLEVTYGTPRVKRVFDSDDATTIGFGREARYSRIELRRPNGSVEPAMNSQVGRLVHRQRLWWLENPLNRNGGPKAVIKVQPADRKVTSLVEAGGSIALVYDASGCGSISFKAGRSAWTIDYRALWAVDVLPIAPVDVTVSGTAQLRLPRTAERYLRVMVEPCLDDRSRTPLTIEEVALRCGRVPKTVENALRDCRSNLGTEYTGRDGLPFLIEQLLNSGYFSRT